GVKDSQIKSPLSGMFTASPRFAADGRAPVRFAMEVLRFDLREQFFEQVFTFPRAQHQAAVGTRNFEFHAFLQVELLGIGSWNAHRKTVCPFASVGVDGFSPCLYYVYLSARSSARSLLALGFILAFDFIRRS